MKLTILSFFFLVSPILAGGPSVSFTEVPASFSSSKSQSLSLSFKSISSPSISSNLIQSVSSIEATTEAGSSPSSPSPSPSCTDKLCPGQCIRNGQALTSCNGIYSLVVTNEGRIILVNNNNGETLPVLTPPFPCPVEICVEPSGRVVVRACGDTVFTLDPVIGGACIQMGDDGRVYYVDKEGKRIKAVFDGPIGK
jgi:hypothetical protein